jgi:hypothetical protein
MAVPICPLCGCVAVEYSQQQTLSTQQQVRLADMIVVCHCAMSHRFIVSANEGALPQVKLERAPVRLLDDGTSRG